MQIQIILTYNSCFIERFQLSKRLFDSWVVFVFFFFPSSVRKRKPLLSHILKIVLSSKAASAPLSQSIIEKIFISASYNCSDRQLHRFFSTHVATMLAAFLFLEVCYNDLPDMNRLGFFFFFLRTTLSSL